MASATANQVKVNGSLYPPWVLVESRKNVESKFTAMIRVTAPPSVRSNSNAPIHLVVVLDLDVCGRMVDQQQQQQEEAGRPGLLLLDLLKTMEFIRGELHGTKDQIDVVDAFNGLHMNIDAWISVAQAANQGNLVPTSRRNELKVLLEKAIKHLDEPCSGDDEKRVGFILLLSDGQSNLTESDSRALLSSKYQVHVFGLGINHGDPDPDPAAAGMLHRIAQGCSGTYSSIARADNLNTSMPLMEAVALCLGGLKSVVAINTRVKIGVKLDPKTSDSLMDEESVKISVQPWADDGSSGSRTSRMEKVFTIGDGVLYAGEVKDSIVDIHFRTNETSSRTRLATLTATVEYVDSSSHKKAPPVNCTLPLLVTGTGNQPAIKAYKQQLLPNPMVLLQRVVMFEVLEKLEEFAGKLLKPPTTTTKTTTTTTTTPAPTPTAAADQLRRTWDDLKKQGKSLQVAQKMGSLVDLRWIDDDMEAMASCLQREGVSSGLSCIYSWVSSYKMQRATTTGLPLPANPFLTPAMKEMVRNAKQSVAPSSLVKENTAEMGKQDDTSAQMEPSPSPSVLLKGAAEMDKQDGADGNQNDEKAKLAIRLMDYMDGRFQLFEDNVTSLNISVSEMSDIDRKVLELFKDQMHQAAEKAIIQWRERKASSSSSSVVDDQGARPAPET